MRHFIDDKLRELETVELCGYACKKDSPSSGMARVKVYDERGQAERVGAGLFTAAFVARFPLVPVEEEGRLHDAWLRESFIERIFCRRRWLDLVQGGKQRGRLVEFHADHKFLLLAHGRSGYAELGRLVASAKQYRIDALFDAYEKGFMSVLAQRTTIKKVSDVLQHMLGFFKKQLTTDEKAELLETIDSYRSSLVPLIVPLTLIKHYVACGHPLREDLHELPWLRSLRCAASMAGLSLCENSGCPKHVFAHARQTNHGRWGGACTKSASLPERPLKINLTPSPSPGSERGAGRRAVRQRRIWQRARSGW